LLFISACFPELCVEWLEYNLQRELSTDPSTRPLGENAYNQFAYNKRVLHYVKLALEYETF